MSLCTTCLQVKANGLVVFVPKYGIEGPVYLSAPTPTAEDQAAAGSSSTQAAAGGSGAIPKQGNKPQGRSGQKDKNNTAPGFVLDEEKQMVSLGIKTPDISTGCDALFCLVVTCYMVWGCTWGAQPGGGDYSTSVD